MANEGDQENSKAVETTIEIGDERSHAVFGSPDDLKLKSSMTVFGAVPATFPVFGQVLDKFYGGKRDERTLQLLSAKKA